MDHPLTGQEGLQSLASVLGQGRELSWVESLDLVRQLAGEVEALHANGQIHRAIAPENVLVDSRLQACLAPPPPHCRFGGDPPDEERCPMEWSGGPEVELPSDLESAAAAIAKAGYSIDPRRIDVYQLGALACRLLTGQSVLAYMCDPRLKARVPRPARPVLSGALGLDSERCFADCSALAAALDDAIGQGKSAAPTAAHDVSSAGRNEDADDAGPAAANERLPFERLGQFRVLGRIGRGGMGEVYEGWDESLGRHVALKVLPAALARDEDFARRFRAEAAAAANIAHPNVVAVHFIGEDAGHPFFAMQFIEGESLAQRLHRCGRLPVDEAIQIAAQCLSGLGAAHLAGVIHRDIKPSNILLDARASRAVLVDFGLVRLLGRNTRRTAVGTVMGTVEYMAPEQAQGKEVDGRTDIYAMGVVLYEALAGRLPFEADSATAMILRHAFEDPQPLEEIAPDVPPAVAEIVKRMMAKNPADRYPHCAAVLDDIRAYQRSASRGSATHQRPTAAVPAASERGARISSPAAVACPGSAQRRSERLSAGRGRRRVIILGLCGAVAAMGLTLSLSRAWLAPWRAGPKPPAVAIPPQPAPRTIRQTTRYVVPPAATPASKAGPPVRFLTEAEATAQVIRNAIGMELVRIEAGDFLMGTDKPEFDVLRQSKEGKQYLDNEHGPNELPAHEVTISKPFYMGRYEVTQAEFQQVMGKNPSTRSFGPGDKGRYAVDSVTWYEARSFCTQLSAMPEEQAAGRRYSLPTEAEWEYACRAGSAADDYVSGNYGNDRGTKMGGSHPPNAFGLYDVHGNVWEWCRDFYHPDAYQASARVDPVVARGGLEFVIRGGSYADPAIYCRSAFRGSSLAKPAESGFPIGLRVVCRFDSQVPESLPAETIQHDRAIGR